jgi:EAL domain-containing protein (putative c-di-GMP-specific phosphodiesterase class I)
LGSFDVAVNTTAAELSAPGFAASVVQRLGAHGVPPEWCAMEIDDATLNSGHETVIDNLKMLSAAGMKIVVGGFGSGACSLERLLDVPVRRVKISRSLVARLPTDELARKVVRTSVTACRHLGIHTVAEGVETAEMLELVADLGCDAAQGFWFSPAVPTTELTSLMLHFGTWR